ncbi:MAG: M48 family metalloprotease [Pseudomonadota bacterium]
MKRLLLPALALLLGACAQNPATGDIDFVMMSEYEEMGLGKKGHQVIVEDYGVYADPALQQYIEAVGKKLVQHSHRSNIEYHFTILDTQTVNAFALPGGYIYITRGMLAHLNSEAELAAVLGHEIGHVTARHAVRQYSSSAAFAVGATLLPGMGAGIGQSLVQQMTKAISLGYGREHELESDRLSVEYLARAGYDPQAMSRIIRLLENQETLETEIAKQEGREPHTYHGVYATHPGNDERDDELDKQAQRLTQRDVVEGRDEFLAHIDKLSYGRDSSSGVVKDGVLYHAAYGLAVTLPPGWKAAPMPDVFVAQSPDRAVLLTLNRLNSSYGSAPSLMQKILGNNDENIPLPVSINGLPASVYALEDAKFAVYKSAADVAVVLALRAETSSDLAEHAEEGDRAINSVRALTESEYRLFKPHAVKLLTTTPGLTYAELARDSVLGKHAENLLRLLNGAYPDGEPSAGQTIKIIE